MASEAIITEELICKAAEQLALEGVNPTNETIRQRLAEQTGTKGGSYATIGPVLRAWKARRRAAEASERAREPVPHELAEKAQAYLSAQWAQAVDLANGRLAAERDSLERSRQEFELETAEALALAEKREDERDEARRQATEVSDRLQRTREELSAAIGRASAAEAKLVELERRAEVLAADLRLERERRDSAETARRDAEVAAGRVAGEVAALREALSQHEVTIREFAKKR
ncbi:TPA: DNA-binding protein [Burkholderia orbicola]